VDQRRAAVVEKHQRTLKDNLNHPQAHLRKNTPTNTKKLKRAIAHLEAPTLAAPTQAAPTQEVHQVAAHQAAAQAASLEVPHYSEEE